jgi:RNA polymerase sigma factor (sigma-70 family)
MTRGDEMAYRTFHAAYFGRLSRYLLVVAAGNDQLMRDALQETFRRVVRNIRTFDQAEIFWSWLTVVGRTALADERRKTSRYARFLQRFTAEMTTPAEEPAPREDQLGEALDRSLAALTPDDRQLVEWKYNDRESVRDIAARLQTTEGAIESRLVRIRRKLKDGLSAELSHDAEP